MKTRKKRKPQVQAPPRSRYEQDDDLTLEDDSEPIYLPPHIDLESMTKAEIAAVSMRHLGRRPADRDTKEAQIAAVRRGLRAGLPGFVRGG